MPRFSKQSLYHLHTCEPDLQMLFEAVVEEFDCTIIIGHRGMEDQNSAFRNGLSKQTWPLSKHNSSPSRAVDVAPYPIDWTDTGRFYYFAGFVECTARRLGIKVRYGGDWDGDRHMNDQNFMDLVHFELLD